MVDHRADLFSLGVVLYEMLAGVRPFSGDSHADLVASILTRDPPPLPGSVPRAVQGVVSRCLEKRPEDRFSTARDVAYALEAALESTPARVMEQQREEPRPYPGLAVVHRGGRGAVLRPRGGGGGAVAQAAGAHASWR